MATIYRFPVMIWQDVAGCFTATVAEGSEGTAVGKTLAGARDQLADYLEWTFRHEMALPMSTCEDPRLLTINVRVRAEYLQDERRYPCQEEILLRVPCVVTRLENGLFGCSAPTIGVRFYFHEERGLSELLPHYVQRELERRTPREISRYGEPPHVELVEIVVRLPTRERDTLDVVKTPRLEEVADSLIDRRLRKQFGPAWQRDNEVAILADILRSQSASVLIVGAPGSGKSTVLSAAVRLCGRLAVAEHRESPRVVARPIKHRFWLTSASRLMAGMKYLGQWEERCEGLIHELQQIGGVLCVEHLLDLVRSGGETPHSGAAAFFATYMQRREVRLVAEATPEEVDACRRLLPGFVEQFVMVKLPEFGRADAVTVLDRLAVDHERNRKISVARGVTEYLVHAFQRFMPYYAFPGRAAAFLDSLCDAARRDRRTIISADDVSRYLSQRTGLPEQFLRDEVLLAPAAIEETFCRRVVGQSGPCRSVTQLVTAFKAGLNDPRRPIGVLLFCGPTGVGKTELAKALSDYFFGHGEQKNRLLRLDMSEYAGPGSGERLMTAPDGSPSQLIKQFRQQPFQVLLLDEIEKATAEVFDVLMNVFDEGRLTDRFGRVTSFRSAVIVMTSNLGSTQSSLVGFGPTRTARYVDEALAFFRPEFFNRIDSVVSFDSLSRETILAITRKELGELADREGLRAAELKLVWSEEVIEHLAQVGFDPRYGARPLQRALEESVIAPLARLLVASPALRRRVIALSVAEGSITISTR